MRNVEPTRLCLVAIAFLLVSTAIAGADGANGLLVFEMDRYTYPATASEGVANSSQIQQKFKVPLTDEFISSFTKVPSQNSSGTGFCCVAGNVNTRPSGTWFVWWIRKTADNRWWINMWGGGSETIEGVTRTTNNPKTSQECGLKRWEDLDMRYTLSYDGVSISFTAKYVTAKDIDAEQPIPAAPVQRADHSEFFKGDDLSRMPFEIRCFFQEG